MGDPRDWITVASLPGLGAISVKQLWEAGWTPEKLLAADIPEWQRLGLKTKTIHALSSLSMGESSVIQRKVDEAFRWIDKTPDSRILTITSPEYPSLLREIADPPPVLFCRGNLTALNIPQLAIVGSRNPSATGLRNAYNFSAYLAQNGLIINSGLASGIDAAAHQGCVDHDCNTVAVFGTGLNRVYPARNKKLADQVLDKQGVWVSEFFPDVSPLAANFPKRNRIISGMSVGVLVVEAAVKSGSLITARMAIEQNREVFAIPGPLNNPLSRGCHKLIRDGALLIESADEIISEIGHILSIFSTERIEQAGSTQKQPIGPLSALEQQLIDSMGFEVLNVDQIIINSGIQIHELAQMLVTLELKGFITKTAGGYIRL
ncbi:MAG: DNA-processing protein DprA [Neptuniibacter sp.]